MDMDMSHMSTGMDDDEISFLTDTYEPEDDDQPPLPKDPYYTTEETDEFEPKRPKKIQLTKALAIKGISKVSLNQNEFRKVNKHLGKVVSLHLQKKGIQILLPDVLESFYSLAHLYLYGNRIEKIQGLECLPQLESLHLYDNRIHRIENLGNCTNLRRLYLGQNDIEVVEGLENLSMLLELHVEDQRLPPEQPLLFCPNSMDTICRKLKVFNISGNQLECIEDITCMEVLDTFYASRNHISDLNHATNKLSTMRSLRVVDLRNNPITKNTKYKERLVGNLHNIEVLDSKDINETTKCFLQRLCSIKSMRMRRQPANFPMAKESQSRSNAKASNSSNFFPSTQSFHNPQRNSDTNIPPHFQFSTPISFSPNPEHHQNLMHPFASMPQELQGQGIRTREFSKVPSKLEMEKFYASRSLNQLEVEKDPERMSEMAKIIFRLSNLSPSTDETVPSMDNHAAKGREDPYWGTSVGHVAIKESRPLSPLEAIGSLKSSTSSKGLGARKSAPMRRPMARKLPPRSSVGAGRTLSPLEELPTPDSLIRENQNGDWIGQAFKTSTCTLPPWLNSRKKAGGPSKAENMS